MNIKTSFQRNSFNFVVAANLIIYVAVHGCEASFFFKKKLSIIQVEDKVHFISQIGGIFLKKKSFLGLPSKEALNISLVSWRSKLS